MKRIMALAALAALIGGGCASDEYQGGTYDGTGQTTGTVGSSVDRPTGVLSDPNTIGGRSRSPADSVGGMGQGPEPIDRGSASSIITNAPNSDELEPLEPNDNDLDRNPDMLDDNP